MNESLVKVRAAEELLREAIADLAAADRATRCVDLPCLPRLLGALNRVSCARRVMAQQIGAPAHV